MADKIHPSSKQSAGAGAGNANPTFPANKSQLYNSTRPVYLPLPRRNRRTCCRTFCLYTTFLLLLLILIAAVAGGVFYLIYRPHRLSFAVTSLNISQFNLTSSNQLTTRFNLTVTIRNPNRKIAFHFDPVSVAIDSDGVDLGDGSIPAFVTPKKNTTTLRAVVAASGRSVEDNGGLKSDLKNNRSLVMRMRMDTKVKVKIGSLKMKKVPVRVVCKGIKVTVPAGKSAAAVTAAKTSGVKCKVDLRVKIWKWRI